MRERSGTGPQTSESESRLILPESAKFELSQTGGNQKIMEAGQQRLDRMKSGVTAFKEGFMSKFRGMGQSIEKGVVAVLSAPEAGKAAASATGRGIETAGQKVGAGAERVAGAVKKGTETAARYGAGKAGEGKEFILDRAADVQVGVEAAGRKIGHTAERAAGAVKQGAETAGRFGKETVGKGKEYVLDRAADLKDRADNARDKFSGRINEIQTAYQSRMEQTKAGWKQRKEKAEYRRLLKERPGLERKMDRLRALEMLFGELA